MYKELPDRFIEWAYFQRTGFVKSIMNSAGKDSAKFLIESTRHNPTLCTGRIEGNRLILNAKVVGSGFVPKREFIQPAIQDLKAHVETSDHASDSEYSEHGVRLLLKHLYHEDRAEARRRMDFSKLSTLEMAAGIGRSSKHTWLNVQSSSTAVLTYYMPPNISFEVRGQLDVHTAGTYHEFVNLVHDTFHRAPATSRTYKPCYIVNVEEVYDNSVTNNGFGVRLV